MLQQWQALKGWQKFWLIIFTLTALLYGIGEISQSPDQRAINGCITRQNKAAGGSLSRSQLEQSCQLMRIRGEI